MAPFVSHRRIRAALRLCACRYQAVRTASWKYVRILDESGAQELYDLHADHYALVNLAGRDTTRDELRRWSAELAKVFRPAE